MIPVFDQNQIDHLTAFLSQPRKIVITTHFKPDGDAMGSTLALYNYLVSKKHKVKAVVPSEYPSFLNFLKGNEKVVDFLKKPKQVAKCFNEAELIFCLDFNESKRVEEMETVMMDNQAIKVVIDHHLDPKIKCDYLFSFPESCATCELIFHFIKALDAKYRFKPEVAECIYTGIMTDTGSFRFSSMSADTHRVIATLLDSGMNHVKVHETISDTFTEERTRFLGYCLKEKMQVIHAFRAAYIAVNKSELEQYNHQTGDTEGIVNYPLSISGIQMSALFTEKDDGIKISFRSKGNFSVRELAAKFFNGGGHKNASGGKFMGSLDEAVERFIASLEFYKDQLQSA
jgi:phosphoesterase RecJ-like protein